MQMIPQQMDDEKWRTIPSMSKYVISDKGNIKKVITGKLINTRRANAGGYYVANLKTDSNKWKTSLVHRLVALTFILNPNNYRTVDHINRKKTDNRMVNLRWANSKMQNANRENGSEHRGPKRAVIQMDNHGKILKVWKSGRDAARSLFLDISGISRACRSRSHIYRQWKWIYQDMLSDAPEEKWVIKQIGNVTMKLSNLGRVKFPNGRVTRGAVNNAYLCVTISGKDYLVHRLMGT